MHRIDAGPATSHGSFSATAAPVLTVDSGESVTVSTLDGDWLTESLGGPPARHGAQVAWRRPGIDDGHALVGPIAVRGALPGMTLKVSIGELRTGSWGWSRAGGRDVELDRELGVDHGERHYLRWELDRVAGVATSNEGHRVRMRPFLGVLGCAPELPGLASTHPPRRTGGNIDCRELVAGTELYLPIEVAGALFSAGDGHAAQGDGELGSTAIECPMDAATLTLELLPGLSLRGPRARTAEGWLTFGFAETLDAAAFEALRGMADLMQELHGFHRKEALNVASQVVDLRITQIVNGVKGVHAVLPDGRLLD